MTWITQNWTSGQLNALVKKIGGEEVARGILDDSLVFKIEKPAVPPLLDVIGTHLMSATTESFIVKNHFKTKEDRGICSYLSDNFKLWFLGKTEEPRPETMLKYSKLTRQSFDVPILAELGNTADVMLGEVFHLMETGTLRKDTWYVFYAEDVNGDRRAVDVYWRAVGWYIRAHSVESPFAWSAGSVVFSRNS